MASTTSITHENTGDDQDFVAVTSKRSSMKNMKPARRNNKSKGKGRWEPPVEKPLSVLLQQKIDLLRGSLFLQACQGKLYFDTLRSHFTCKVGQVYFFLVFFGG